MTVVTVEVEEVLRSFTDTKVEIQVKVTEKLLLSVLFETVCFCDRNKNRSSTLDQKNLLIVVKR